MISNLKQTQGGVLKQDQNGRQYVAKIDLNEDTVTPIREIINSVLRVQENQLRSMSESLQADCTAILDEKYLELLNKFNAELDKIKKNNENQAKIDTLISLEEEEPLNPVVDLTDQEIQTNKPQSIIDEDTVVDVDLVSKNDVVVNEAYCPPL